nr:upf0051 protein abci8, chloroplastic [Quercus suber]
MYMMMMNSNKSESRESTELEEAGGRYHDEDNRLKSNNKIELTRIRLMRSFVETQDPCSKEVDDLMIRRFLRARDLNVEKASALFLKYLKWRQTFVPNGSISASELPHEIAQNKMFIQGFDKTGRPIAVVLGARHFQTEGGIEEFKRFVVYGLDKLCSRMPPGQEKFVFIADLEGWGYSNSDIRAYLGALSILQVKNPTTQIKHEASTSKIGEDQLFYFQQRGIEYEKAMATMISRFCRDVFNELPDEFGFEVNQLMSLMLEGSVG